MKLSPSGAISDGTLISRGRERGAGTIARPLSRPNASFPSRERMKFRLLFTSRGKGWAGSSPNGLTTG